MSITIEAIKFNHDPDSAAADALNIRKNQSQFIAVPEWREGVCIRPEDSLAAYAVKETRGHTITIQAQFRSTGEGKAQVRAIDPATAPQEPGGCLGWLRYLLFIIFQVIYGNVLGEVKERWVDFGAGGDSGFCSFELKNLRLWSVGVGIHYTTWKWQYRLHTGAAWVDMGTTRHKIYVLLELPKDPWRQSPYVSGNDQLPWTEVMEYSCLWAVAAADRDTAAARVTERVNALGPALIEYDCPGGGYSHYSAGTFKCTEFLERLGGGQGLGRYVNCSDCASIVSTFSNILGCELWQSRMGSGFALNEVLAVGSAAWDTPCGWSSFNYHEVAWKGACEAEDEVFDACLKVDGDDSPRTAPHTPLLPVNMRFGDCAALLYRYRLTSAGGCPNCDPQADTRQHREVI